MTVINEVRAAAYAATNVAYASSAAANVAYASSAAANVAYASSADGTERLAAARRKAHLSMCRMRLWRCHLAGILAVKP